MKSFHMIPVLVLASCATVQPAVVEPPPVPSAWSDEGVLEQTVLAGEQLDVLVGELRSAPSLLEGDSPCAFEAQALRAGHPGAVVWYGGFTVLLVDGRLLARLYDEQQTAAPRVRVTGLLQDDGRSVIPFRLESDVNGEWVVFDLPYSGVSGTGVEGGDE